MYRGYRCLFPMLVLFSSDSPIKSFVIRRKLLGVWGLCIMLYLTLSLQLLFFFDFFCPPFFGREWSFAILVNEINSFEVQFSLIDPFVASTLWSFPRGFMLELVHTHSQGPACCCTLALAHMHFAGPCLRVYRGLMILNEDLSHCFVYHSLALWEIPFSVCKSQHPISI